MKLEDCKTIKECLIWAEGEWEGFWDFATHQPMSYSDVEKLSKAVLKDTKLNQLLQQIKKTAQEDKSEEGRKLLALCATSFRNIKEILNGPDKTKNKTKRR